ATKHYAASARLYAEALEGDLKLADDTKLGHRFRAACSAALAGAGKGDDQPPPDKAGRATLRQQARDWLRAALLLHRQQLASGTDAARRGARARLEQWKADSDLAGVRDADDLDKLPKEEQHAWRLLWNEVDTLLRSNPFGL